MRSGETTRWIGVVALVALGLAARVALGAQLGLLADEAYYWVWSGRLALGYYDQPPLVAWALAAARLVSDAPVALRLPGALAAGIGVAALLPHARERELLAAWWLALPPLFWLTLFATPDALLLGAWAVGLGAACAGGRGWLVAGVAAGCAFEAKHSGAALFPLLLLAADPGERRSGWPWAGLALACALAAPNLWWNAQHDWVTVRFQLGEGLLGAAPPGWTGPLREIAEQLGVLTPIAGLTAYAWLFARAPDALSGRLDRAERFAWWTSAPLALFFAAAALGARPEAHWPAPAWIGVGLGLAQGRPRWSRAAWTGLGLGAAASVVLAAQAFYPVLPLPKDPATRVAEGPPLAGWAAAWALPEGVGVGEARAVEATPVMTERYQEAALIAYYAEIPARVLPGCGRRSQYDLWPEPAPPRALFVRPATGGPPTCAVARYGRIDSGAPFEAVDPWGRIAGRWQIFPMSEPLP